MMNVLTKSVSNAKKLINAKKVDTSSDWSFSAVDGNKLLGETGDDWASYALWHLAEDPDATEDTKARYKYPYGKNGKVYRSGVIAAKARAAQQGEDAIATAAGALLTLIDSVMEIDEEDGCGIKKPKGKMDSVSRIDAIEPGSWMTTPFIRTTEGFLIGRAIVTCVGVFNYRNTDGSITRELRLPEEVFDMTSLETLKLKPLTEDHPTEMVTSENVKTYQVGNLGGNPSRTVQDRNWNGYTEPEDLTDGFHVAVDMVVQEAGAIQSVLQGKAALSMGYNCDLEQAEPDAVWCGQAYDKIQRRIRYNHCAIVDSARAGDAAKIRLDSADAVLIPHSDHRQQEEPMKTIKLDGVDYQAEAPVIVKLSQETNRADTAEKLAKDTADKASKDLSAMEAERDTLKEKLDAKEKELADAKALALDPAKLDAAVQAKLILRETAQKAGVETKADMSDLDLKKAVITKVFPNAKLDGRDEVYIQARFDAVAEDLASVSHADSNVRFIAGGSDLPVGDPKLDAAAARQRMIDGYNKDKEVQ